MKPVWMLVTLILCVFTVFHIGVVFIPVHPAILITMVLAHLVVVMSVFYLVVKGK